MSAGVARSRLGSPNLLPTVRALRQADKAVAAEWRKRARLEVAVPWAAELAAQAPGGSKGAAAARSIQAGTGQLPTIWAGKGSWQGWQPFYALEFGMSHSKYHTYVRTSSLGNRHFVRRRTGTWAQPHKGRTGYFLWPYWRRNDARLTDKVARLIDQTIEANL
jgi:hypothetical protein